MKKTRSVILALAIILALPVTVIFSTVADSREWGCRPVYMDGFKGCPLMFNILCQMHNIKHLFDK